MNITGGLQRRSSAQSVTPEQLQSERETGDPLQPEQGRVSRTINSIIVSTSVAWKGPILTTLKLALLGFHERIK